MADTVINFHGSDIVSAVFNEMLTSNSVSEDSRSGLQEYLRHNGGIFDKEMRGRLSQIALGDGKVTTEEVNEFYSYILEYQKSADEALGGYDNIGNQVISRVMLDMRDGKVTQGGRDALKKFLDENDGVLGPGLTNRLNKIAKGDGEVTQEDLDKLSKMMGNYSESIKEDIGAYNNVGDKIIGRLAADMRDGQISQSTRDALKAFIEKRDGTLGPGLTKRLDRIANGDGEVTQEDLDKLTQTMTNYSKSIDNDLEDYKSLGQKLFGRLMADMRDGQISEGTRKSLGRFLERNDGSLGPGLTKKLENIANGDGAVTQEDIDNLSKTLGNYQASIKKDLGGYDSVGRKMIGRVMADMRDGQISQATRDDLLAFMQNNNGVFDVEVHNHLAEIALGDGKVEEGDIKEFRAMMKGYEKSIDERLGGYESLGHNLIGRVLVDMQDGQVTERTRAAVARFIENNDGLLGPGLQKKLAKVANGDGEVSSEDFAALQKHMDNYQSGIDKVIGDYDGVGNRVISRVVADMRDGEITEGTRDALKLLVQARGGNLGPGMRKTLRTLANGDGAVTEEDRKEFESTVAQYSRSISKEASGYDGYASKTINRVIADMRDGSVTEGTQASVSNLLEREGVEENLDESVAASLRSIAEDKDREISKEQRKSLVGSLEDYSVAQAKNAEQEESIFPPGTTAAGSTKTASGSTLDSFTYDTGTGNISGVAIGATPPPSDPSSMNHNTAADDALSSN